MRRLAQWMWRATSGATEEAAHWPRCCCGCCVHECSVTHSCPTLWDPMDYSSPGSSVHRILQVRILEWVPISYFRGSSRPRDGTSISRNGRQILYHWASWEAQLKPLTVDTQTLVIQHWNVSLITDISFILSFNRTDSNKSTTLTIVSTRYTHQQSTLTRVSFSRWWISKLW